MRVAAGEFDTIVSLGSNCAPASAIRRHFNCEIAFPFDWCISSLDEMVRAANNHFRNMFVASEMEIYKVVDWSVRSRRIGIAYHHDFSRTDDGYDLERVLRELPQVEAKYARRIERLRHRAAGGRTLFIRYGIDSRGKSHDAAVADIFELDAALRQVFACCDFDLLALDSEAAGEPVAPVAGARVAFDVLGADTGEMWRHDQFVSMFQRRAITLSDRFRSEQDCDGDLASA